MSDQPTFLATCIECHGDGIANGGPCESCGGTGVMHLPIPPVTPRPGGTRAEHLAWCKLRALQYLPGDPAEALASMFSDLGKHGELYGHPAIMLGAALMYSGLLRTADEVHEYIEGFN